MYKFEIWQMFLFVFEAITDIFVGFYVNWRMLPGVGVNIWENQM